MSVSVASTPEFSDPHLAAILRDYNLNPRLGVCRPRNAEPCRCRLCVAVFQCVSVCLSACHCWLLFGSRTRSYVCCVCDVFLILRRHDWSGISTFIVCVFPTLRLVFRVFPVSALRHVVCHVCVSPARLCGLTDYSTISGVNGPLVVLDNIKVPLSLLFVAAFPSISFSPHRRSSFLPMCRARGTPKS